MGDFRSGKKGGWSEIWGIVKSFSKPQMKQQIFNYSKIYIELVMLPLGLDPELYTIILI